MASFIVLLVVICSVFLGLIVLVQNPKGGGLAIGFQGTQQVGGVQRTTDFLEKATWYLGTALLVLCLVSAYFYASERPAGTTPPVEETSGAPVGEGTTETPAGGNSEQPTP